MSFDRALVELSGWPELMFTVEDTLCSIPHAKGYEIIFLATVTLEMGK